MKQANIIRFFFLLLGASALAACEDAGSTEPKRFELLTAEETGIDFVNQLTETPVMNIFNYMYFYNGAGVAVGDVNNDGLPDIYFTSNQDANRLYLNLGDFKFEDITEVAGVVGETGWTTGVTMVDVNGDGLLDIYVSQLGQHLNYQGKNQLYINLGVNADGVPVFENRAEQWGLDLVGYATQATFFDYDLDGDLDIYMLNHSVHQNGTFGQKEAFEGEIHPTAGDRLLRNDGNYFTDVTAESGIKSTAIGYGLGVTASDINLDGYPDLYIGNDFHEDDYLYLSNGDGTFANVAAESLMHTSRFSMGNDIGDINNDGFPDLLSLDMLPENPIILKASAAEDAYDIYHMKLKFGYGYQFARNTLQLNLGMLPNQSDRVRFSEIGSYAGIAATDWSWSGLIVDLDNDGWNDIFVSNGILGRSNDLDYINYVIADSIQAKIGEGLIDENDLRLTKLMPEIKLPNYAYRNKGDFTFENMVEQWGLTHSTYSHGTAYADLDNDGDLDLIINNVNDPASIYKNRTSDGDFADHNYLKINLEGKAPNLRGLGAKILLRLPQGTILREVTATRGFQSSVDVRPNIGLGGVETVDELTIIWPDGAFQILNNVPANETLTVKQSDAAGQFDYLAFKTRGQQQAIFRDMSATLTPDFVHQENDFVEFNREPLMPHMVSAEGPKLAVGDANGDGLEDFYVGGAKWQSGALFIQQANGRFARSNEAFFQQDSLYEDTDAVFFDADGDGDQDLLVASGGNEFLLGKEPNQPRLYLNDGQGQFSRASDQLPDITLTASVVLAFDYDADGDLDLFLGARAVPSVYGEIPASYLLENDGQGNFIDVTAQRASALSNIGLVKHATAADMNGDGTPELILACEWSPIRILLNKNGNFEPMELANSGLEDKLGWWNSVIAADFDGDGDNDLIVGNLGLNSKLNATPEEPVRMYYGDFDENGTKEQLLTYYINGKEYLFYTYDEVTKQLPYIKKRYLKYTSFAEANLTDIVERSKLSNAKVFEANYFASAYIENLSDGKFAIKALPRQVQFSTVNAGLVRDFDQDGNLDVLLAGNFYENNIQMGRYDASYGNLLRGNGDGTFEAMSLENSGVLVPGQTRDMQLISLANGKQVVIFARNRDSLKMLEWNVADAVSLSAK